MSNCAVITTSTDKDLESSSDIGVYLHWSGDRIRVEAFLTYCQMQGFRPPEQDNYGWARLCQVIANTFNGTLSVGIDQLHSLDCDNHENGVYIIKNWEIVDRKFNDEEDEEISMEALQDALDYINEMQPEHMKIQNLQCPKVDWTKVPVDTPVLVKYKNHNTWTKRYFAKYENGAVYVFDYGADSWTYKSVSQYPYVKLANKEE